MARLIVVQNRIESLGQLLEVVSAMRSLASIRMQQAVRALAGARRYADIIAAALSQALAMAEPEAEPKSPGRHAVLLLCAEHAFVGGYNEALTSAARASAPEVLYVLGSRGAVAAEERGMAMAWRGAMTTQAAGLPALARRLSAEIQARFAHGEFRQLDAIFGQWEAGGRWRIERRQLLPVAPPPIAARIPGIPLHYLPVGELVESLIEEHLFADLIRAATESLASENAARFQAMNAARDNITRKLETLQGDERRLRQEQITEELLDVVTGADVAMSG